MSISDLLARRRGMNGMLELGLAGLYLAPRTAPIGAVLWTGYLGVVMAARMQHGWPWVLVPIWIAALLWVPILLRFRATNGLHIRRT
jgi:hypothetical protein